MQHWKDRGGEDGTEKAWRILVLVYCCKVIRELGSRELGQLGQLNRFKLALELQLRQTDQKGNE